MIRHPLLKFRLSEVRCTRIHSSLFRLYRPVSTRPGVRNVDWPELVDKLLAGVVFQTGTREAPSGPRSAVEWKLP